MFIRNAWYHAGFSAEFEYRLVERRVIGESLALYRTTTGTPVALANRCPHRFAPLALGNLVSDNVQCAYHGLVFDQDGHCLHIPGQNDIPPGAGVRAYPIVERFGCVWVWMGDPALADQSKLIDEFRYLTEPGWRAVSGMREVRAGYELIIDNLMDLTHIAFLHPKTLGNQGSPAIAQAEPTVTVRDDSVSVDRVMVNSAPAPLFTKVRSFDGPIDRYQYSTFIPPCYVLIELKVVPTGTQDVEAGLQWRVYHIVTPVSATETRYSWALTRPFAIEDDAISQALHAGTDAVLAEDQWMIEAQARVLEEISLDERTLHTRFDANPAHARRIIRNRIRREDRQPQAIAATVN